MCVLKVISSCDAVYSPQVIEENSPQARQRSVMLSWALFSMCVCVCE